MLSSSRPETLTRNETVEPSEPSLEKVSLQHAERRSGNECLAIWIPAGCEFDAGV